MQRVCPATMVGLEKLNPVSYLPTIEQGGTLRQKGVPRSCGYFTKI